MENLALTESTYYILLSLYHPQHGYGIMQQTEQLSGGRVRLAAGTLYGALNALCEKGWISPLPMESGSRKKEYQLTETGLAVLKRELARLEELAANGRTILKEELSWVRRKPCTNGSGSGNLKKKNAGSTRWHRRAGR